MEGTPTTSLKKPWADAPIDQGQTSGSLLYASTDPLIAAFTTLALREIAADSSFSAAGRSSMSSNPFGLRCSRNLASCFCYFMFGTWRECILDFCTAGVSGYVPCFL